MTRPAAALRRTLWLLAWLAAGPVSAGDPVPWPVGGNIMAPEPLAPCLLDLPYTDKAREAGIEGVIIVQVHVDTAGRAMEVRVIRRLGHGLDEVARKAVLNCRFRPARDRYTDEAVDVLHSMSVPFELPEEKPQATAATLRDPTCLEGVALTEEARLLGLSGDVVLRCSVDAKGGLGEVKVMRGLGHGLDEAALAALRLCELAPGHDPEMGGTVATTTSFVVRFAPARGRP